VSIARKEGWISLAEAEPRQAPPSLTVAEIVALGEVDREAYNQARADWHANLGPLRTPDLGRIHDELWELLDANRQDSDRVRGAAAIDAYPGLGKTTAALSFAKAFHRREIALYGPTTTEGHEHLPVARIGLTSNTTMRGFNQALCDFYGHPGAARGTAGQLASRALDCVLSCATSVIVIDLHFIDFRRRHGTEVSNHLKWLANEMPATFIFSGVGLSRKRFFDEGLAGDDIVYAQTSRRATRCPVVPFTLETTSGYRAWVDLLAAFEKHLVLLQARPGMLTEHAKLLFARTQGYIGSLTNLLDRACHVAITTGTETLTSELLSQVTVDNAAQTSQRSA
jgi:hypothetical protein